jgi:hypothetical protein
MIMIKNGDKVTVKGDGSGEVFEVSQLSDSKCWIGDEQGRGWFIGLGELEIVESEEETPEGLFPSFFSQYGRKPIAGKDYDPDGSLCQDDYEYLSGSGRYSDHVTP